MSWLEVKVVLGFVKVVNFFEWKMKGRCEFLDNTGINVKLLEVSNYGQSC